MTAIVLNSIALNHGMKSAAKESFGGKARFILKSGH